MPDAFAQLSTFIEGQTVTFQVSGDGFMLAGRAGDQFVAVLLSQPPSSPVIVGGQQADFTVL